VAYILALLGWLSRQSELHCKHYNICGFFSRISEGILLGQYKLIRNNKDMPLAFAVKGLPSISLSPYLISILWSPKMENTN
jgi:hemolysin-activating ACP:hemolysin acyltransferase